MKQQGFYRCALAALLFVFATGSLHAQAAGTFRFLTATVPNGSTNGEYFAKLFVANAAGPVSFSVKTGCGAQCAALPTGIQLHEQTGALYGKPTVVETKNVTIVANDGVSNIELNIDKFKISAAGGGGNSGASFATTSLPEGRVAQPYTLTLASLGGVGPFIWGAQNLPVGITLDGETGELSGSPLVAGTYYVTFTNHDRGENNVATTTLPLTVYPADSDADYTQQPPLLGDNFFKFETYMLNNGEVGSAYQDQYLTSGASGSVRYSAMGLPAGLSLDAETGVVSGTPQADTAGTHYVTVTAEDTGAQTSSLVSINLPLWIAPSSSSNFYWAYFGTPAALYGTAYTSSLGIYVAALNGGSVTYSALGLPAGISYSSTSGQLSGTPTEVGVFPVVYTASSTTHGTITLKTDFVVLPPGGGDVGRLAVNLWLKKLALKVSPEAGANDAWQAQYIYNADRRSGKIFNPYSEAMLLGMAASSQTLAANSLLHSEKTGVFSYKSAKADQPALSIKGAPATQQLSVRVAAADLGMSLPVEMLQNDIILGSKGYRLKISADSKGKFSIANGYRNASFVVNTAALKHHAGSTKNSLQLAMLLADPSLLNDVEFISPCPTENKNCNRPSVAIKLYQGSTVLLEKNLTDLLAAARTTEKNGTLRTQIKKVVKQDGEPVNTLKGFVFDSKTGNLKINIAALELAQSLSNQQAHIGVEVRIGSMSYFTSLTLFETKQSSRFWSSKVSAYGKPYPVPAAP